MKFLIDTNIFIPLEPAGPADVGSLSPAVMELVRIVSAEGHQLYVHPSSLDDISRDRNPDRRKLRQLLFSKYPILPYAPEVSAELESLLGPAERDSHDWVDHKLIAALQADSVDFLVTEDRDLRKKSARAGLDNRVANVAEATSIVRDLFDKTPKPPPAVTEVPAHVLNDADPIFESLRQDYPDFDGWLKKCKREHRKAWIIETREPHIGGLAIVKHETSGEFGLRGKVMKLCTFKVSQEFNGLRYGELLLRAAFDYARVNQYDHMFVTLFEKHEELLKGA